MAEKKYYIKIQGKPIDVSKEIYDANNRAKRQVRTQKERDRRHGLLHIEGFDTDTSSGEEMLYDQLSESVEEKVVASIMSEQLHRCIAMLPRPEQELINALYFAGKSERQYSTETGIPQKTINDRKHRTLRKLKKLLEKSAQLSRNTP